MRLTVYVKSCCPLCDEALHVIEGVRRTTSFEVDVVDISSDDDLFQRYRNLIPVVTYRDEELFYGKVSAHRLKEILSRVNEADSTLESALEPRYRTFLRHLRTLLNERTKSPR